MENMDMFNNATAQLTFHDFLDRMRHPSAADLVRSIKNFIGTFLNNPPEPERDSQSVQEFLTNTENAFKAHPLWAGATEDEFESSGEGLEKYLMTKLFARAFAPLPEDAEQDQRLSERMTILQQFIRPEHLDIRESFQNETSWLLAQKELQKINAYKAPRDKLVCILNCCRVINNLLLNVSMATNDTPPGADDFLPVLIYVVIKANPPQLHSNLLYIQRYRHQSRLVSEASYFYTNLVSAESFIANLDSKSLTIDPVEFEKKMEAGRVAMEVINGVATTVVANEKTSSITEKSPLKEKMPKSQAKEVSPVRGERLMDNRGQPAVPPVETANQEDVVAKVVSVEKLEAGAFGQVLEADKTGQLAKDYPFLYASAGDLRVVDVESLLHEYKELVLRYVALSKAVEGWSKADKPPVSLHPDSRVEQSADSQAAVRTESLAQILTRPEERAQLFGAGTLNLQSGPGILSELQESDSRGLDFVGSSGEESVEKSVVEDSGGTLEVTKEEDPLSTKEETKEEDPVSTSGKTKDEDPESTMDETKEVPHGTPSPPHSSTQESAETELRLEEPPPPDLNPS